MARRSRVPSNKAVIAVLVFMGLGWLVYRFSPALKPVLLEGLTAPKKYNFSTIQKAVVPKAECKGYLELDKERVPIAISFTLGAGGKQLGEYEYRIERPCEEDPGTGASVYKGLKPIGATNSVHQASLRISPDKKMFMIRLEPAPPPWSMELNQLSINIKNAQGYTDWKILPPVRACLQA